MSLADVERAAREAASENALPAMLDQLAEALYVLREIDERRSNSLCPICMTGRHGKHAPGCRMARVLDVGWGMT